ncbi:MAG: hypothetical protein ACSHXB_02190 [Sulfitobacter sp.]
MNGAIPVSWPIGAACLIRMGRFVMEIILHIGAHRSGTTTFQQFMRTQQTALAARSVGFWGPVRTRKSIFPGLFPPPGGLRDHRRAEGRVQMHLAQTRQAGVQKLLVSDENMIGSSLQCLRVGALYPAIGDRMARISAAFGGQVTRVVMTIRAQDLWWASAAAFTVARGHQVPTREQREKIAINARTWRDVITDVACAVPYAELLISPFEQSNGNPQTLFKAATGLEIAADATPPWLNRSLTARTLRGVLAEQGNDPSLIPDEAQRWQPFGAEQAAQLRENYADDLHWLIAGADGLATLTEDPTRKRAGTSQPAGHMIRGHGYDGGQDIERGHMAHSG